MDAKILVGDLWRSYPSPQGPVSALEGINFTVAEGEFVALVGPSGCGKSTLLNILAGFDRADRGQVLIDGKSVEGPSRKGIVITQRGSVFPWMNVRRNLEVAVNHLPEAEREALARHYIELVGLKGFEDSFPHQLSGGMLQRVEVARALMVRPDILYMDEPFGALDAITRMRMRTELRRILARDRHTTILVTHDVEEALHLADRVLVISPRPGRVQREIEVAIPHPRLLSSLKLIALKEQVLSELGLASEDLEREIALTTMAGDQPPEGEGSPDGAEWLMAGEAGPAGALTSRPDAPVGEERFDVIVMGGGPGGASTAALLAAGGLHVLVLEQEHFPRFHIGESLLPACWDLWDRLGVTAEIEKEGFVIKQGINFGMFRAPTDVVLLTAEYPEYFQRPYTYHVERARFDEILLDNARRKGAEVREGWTVKNVLFDDGRVTGVVATSENGDSWQFRARIVVDATGRHCLLSRQLGSRKFDPTLNKMSHFTHFKGAWRRNLREFLPEGEVLDGSATTDIHTIDGGWIWYIPLSGDIVSVGVVLDAKQWGHLKGPQERFDAALRACPRVREWVGEAEQMMEMQTVSNISYLNESFVGDGFVLVGDASMFVDPIFSAGVTIALRSGVYAAEAILEAFERQDFSAGRLKPYEDRIRLPMKNIFRMIYNWYTILGKKDPNNIIVRARSIPLLRERLVVLFSGGYDRVELEQLLKEAEAGAGVRSGAD